MALSTKKETDLLPKYGYLVEKGAPYQIINIQYGKFSVVLKDNIRQRSTWTLKDSLDSNLTHPKTFNRLNKNEKMVGGKFQMPEFQVYGPVDISDFDYFLFPDDSTNLPVIKKIKEIGIPIKLYKKIGRFMEKGFKLKNINKTFYAGDLKKRKEYEAKFLSSKKKLGFELLS